MSRAAGLALAMMLLNGGATPAASQEQCPELARLHAEADAALSRATGLVAQERCDAYVHFSVAWAEIARYAHDHRDACDMSAGSLTDIDKRHQQAVAERVDACGGLRKSALPQRREYTFPAEIRPSW
jgi:hypothetical protein